jgi:hypothetical protein
MVVSDIEEYYYDSDINTWFVDESSELVDSKRARFNFKKLNQEQWIPNEFLETLDFEQIKGRVAPLLYMPSHLKQFDGTTDIASLLNLLSKIDI